jgi:hypothetical protein
MVAVEEGRVGDEAQRRASWATGTMHRGDWCVGDRHRERPADRRSREWSLNLEQRQGWQR